MKFKKLKKFWKIYIISCAALTAALGIFLVIFWNVLADYESTRPAALAQSLTKEINDGKYDNFCENLNIVKSEFITKTEVKKQIKEITGGKTVTFSKAFSANRKKNPAFLLSAGKKEIGRIVLEATGKKSFFGNPLYKIEYISDFYNQEKPVTVTVPEEYHLSVSGKKLGEEWIYSTQATLSETGFPLKKKAEKPRTKTYKLDAFLSAAEIKVLGPDGKAQETPVIKEGAANVEYKTLILAAPKGIRPVVNGVEISGGKWTLDEIYADEMTSRIPDKYFSVRPEFTQYKVTGLSSAPEISVADSTEIVTIISETEKGYFAKIYPDAGAADEYQSIAIEFAKTYAKAVSNDYGKGAFLAKILPEAPIRKELGTSLRPEFYSKHTGNYFEDVKASNLFVYSESVFVIDVSLTHCITGVSTSPGKPLKFPSSMRMCFVKQGNVWYLGEWMLQS